MTDTAFKSGDTVKVKSGGPLMTVKSTEGDDVICVWFEGKNKKESRFKSTTLKHDDGSFHIA